MSAPPPRPQPASPPTSNLPPPSPLARKISQCRLCADRFAATATAHQPRPVAWFHPEARLLIAGQAPGLRVHQSGRPFDDRSGERLRDWLGIDADSFYDRRRIAIVPAAFCFPGYDARNADLPPPPICAETWAAPVQAELKQIQLRVLVGGYAHRLHLDPRLGAPDGVTATVRDWRRYAPGTFVLPHPSWRNNGWLRKHPWFEEELLPELRRRVAALLSE